MQGRRLVVVSNREPYVHKRQGGRVRVEQPVGGLTSALDNVLRILGGTWVAWGSGSADRQSVDRRQQVRVPPDRPAYTLKRVWLSAGEVENYYHGYSNHVLWPLCHIALERIYFRKKYWEDYVSANRKFAEAVAGESSGSDIVWIHDYHLALLPAMLREIHPKLTLGHFWHVPWPNYSVLRACPQARELVEGMLANDLIGFQVPHFVGNFMDCVEKLLPEAEVDREQGEVAFLGHRTKLEAFPISVDFDRFEGMASSRRADRFLASFRRKFSLPADVMLAVGVDRLEYTKGLTKRIQAIELFFERYSRYRGRVSFFQVAVPTRLAEPYLSYMRGVQEMVNRVNRRFGRKDWTPIVYTEEKIEHRDLAAVYRAADLCIVSSIYDGMNLVAKEFIACQTEERGVLLLSEFTGAAEELDDAIIVNPYDLESFSSSIRTALAMREGEKKARMARLRSRVREANIHVWIGSIVKALADLAAAKTGGTAYLFDQLKHIDTRDLILFLDFDGTLAPIASTPEEVVLPDPVRKILNKLKRIIPVAVVSGRALDDLRGRVGIPDLIYSGNHGMEIWDGRKMLRKEAGDIERLDELVDRLSKALAPVPGVLVEHKGLSASVHFRRVPPKKLSDVFGTFWEITRDYDASFRFTGGKKVLEIRSKTAWNKGDAVTWILEQTGAGRHPLYIGDDVTDEDAFRALKGRGTSICVGESAVADYHLESQNEVGRFLEWLLIRGIFAESFG